jgi:hypothetical protein
MELSQKYSDTYEHLLNQIANEPKFKKVDISLTGFWPMTGKQYQESGGLMLVGRATNGWTNGWKQQNVCDVSGRKQTINTIHNNSAGGFTWMKGSDGEGYNINRSAFFRVTRSIQAYLLGIQADAEVQQWTKNLCWTNLMKIAPEKGWNPPSWLHVSQITHCKELFDLEIAELCPARVLVLSGKEWFEPFRKSLDLNLGSVSSDWKYVTGFARKASTAWIVAKHPMCKPEGPFVSEIISALRELS